MYIPENLTEEKVLETIKICARRLASKYKFGYFDADDIEQEAIIIVITSNCLEKYDTSRPFENFISSHLRKRLYNFRRDRYIRPDPPCTRCPLSAFIKPDICTAYNDKKECKFYARWHNANISKRNIMNTADIQYIQDSDEKNMRYEKDFLSDIYNSALHKDILDSLSFRCRKFYLMFLNNCRVRGIDKKTLVAEIKEIIGHGED